MNLGTFLYNNYNQVLQIINDDAPALAETLRSLGIMEVDLENWENEEVEYFRVLGKEDQWDIHAVVYIETLQELQAAE